MKKLLYLVFITVVATACSKNQPTPITSISVVGKWTFVSDSLKDFENGVATGAKYSLRVDTHPFFQFNVDSTGVVNYNGLWPEDSFFFTYAMSAKTIKLDYPGRSPSFVSDTDIIYNVTILNATKTDLFIVIDAVGNPNNFDEKEFIHLIKSS